ncbi:DUF4276 family protein [Tumidithrix helvetica]|uniref:DUF4276 family protein n=1 Tax=Tumidithrix helvetica TaxID=3457545 RepID=UPI003CC5723B
MAEKHLGWETVQMIRVIVFCEGQTEETFVGDVLSEHFHRLDIWLTPIVLRTSMQGKGGVVSYHKIKWQIETKCKEDRTAWVTTLLDFYALPSDFPGMSSSIGASSIEQAKAIEKAFQKDIAQPNFIANLVIHEFEGLLFSDPNAFTNWFSSPDLTSKLLDIRNSFDSPEHINDGQATAPSKRILNICSNYEKVLHGSLIALDIGLDTIRRECMYFNDWVERIEALSKTSV